MVRVIGGLAAVAIAALPAVVHPNWRLAAVSVLVGLGCMVGLLLPSLVVTTMGAVFALLVFAAASLSTPAGAAIPEAITVGAALLTILDLAYVRQCARGAWLGPGVLSSHLAGLAFSVTVAAGAVVVLLSVITLLPAAPATMIRPLLAAVGGLLVYVASIRTIVRQG